VKKFISTLLFILFSFLFLTISSGVENKVEIWSWRSQDAEVWARVEKELNKKGIPVKIDFRPFVPTEYDAKVMLALQGGTGPDIFYSRRLPGGRTQALIDAGFIEPLDGKIKFTYFTSNTLKYIRSGGKTYGVPFALQVVGIFYNKDIYDKFGLKEPETWDELINNCEILKKNGVTPFFIPGKEAWTLAMQHAMCGVSVLGPEWIRDLTNGKTNFLDPKFIDLNKRLNDLKKYYQDGFLANSTTDQDSAFAFGQAAMVFYGIWGLQTWRQLNPKINVGYFMVPPLTKDRKPYAYVYMDGAFSLVKGAKNRDMALKVLEFTATPDFGTIFSNITYNIPAVLGAKIPQDPLLLEVLEVSKKHASPYVYWVGSVFVTQKPSLYDDILAPGMQAMYAGKITPEELAQNAQNGISQWYKPLMKKR